MRILIVDDDEAFVRSLTRALNHSGFAVDHARDGRDAADVALSEPYALIILDLGLPGASGFTVLETIRRSGSTVPIMVLTALSAVSGKVRAFDLGADDYLSKPFDLSEFGARVRALVRRGHGAADPLIAWGNLRLDRARVMITVDGEPLRLRRREYRVLSVLISHAGRLVPKQRLISEVFGFDEAVSPNALELYVARLRRKLPPHAPHIRTVRGLGYMLVEAERAND